MEIERLVDTVYQSQMSMDSVPVLYGIERVFTADVIHQYEAHGPSVIRCGNGTVALLARSVLQTYTMELG